MAMSSTGRPRSRSARANILTIHFSLSEGIWYTYYGEGRPSPEPEWRGELTILKGFFQSHLWKYPVHAFIGEVVKAQRYMTNYPDHRTPEEIETKNQIIFNYYCHMVSELLDAYRIEFKADTKDMEFRLNFDLPDALPPPLRDRKDLAIPSNACSYLVAVYNYESFKYITSSYAMDLKQHCLYAAQKLMLLISKNWDTVATYKKLDYIHQMSRNFFEEKLNYSMLKDKSVLMWCIKLTTPVPYVRRVKLTSSVIPVMPSDSKKWEDYFLKIYDTALSSMLDKLKSSYEQEHSKKLKRRNREVVDRYLTKLRNILSSSSMTQEEISKALVPCNSHFISIIREALKTVNS